jgi:tight adherence protein B
MMLPIQTPLLKLLSIALIALGLLWVVTMTLSGETVFNRYYRQYVAHLNRYLKLLFIADVTGERILAVQAIAIVVAAAAALLAGMPELYALVFLAAVGPVLYLMRRRQQHVKQLEEQSDTLILGLANALKTVPSPAAALAAVCPVLPQPMQLEIDRLLKEMRVGSTLEQALLNMSARIHSAEVDAALTSLLIGLQTGGNLPQVLENTASTIREMGRLQGVVKTKTSEARAQLWVLALFPFDICFAFASLQPDFFDPLQKTFVGTLITIVAVILWLASLMTARKILKVDI